MDMAQMGMEFRDTNIIPRYNAAGVRKFAFHMPACAPPIGSKPAAERPTDYPLPTSGPEPTLSTGSTPDHRRAFRDPPDNPSWSCPGRPPAGVSIC